MRAAVRKLDSRLAELDAAYRAWQKRHEEAIRTGSRDALPSERPPVRDWQDASLAATLALVAFLHDYCLSRPWQGYDAPRLRPAILAPGEGRQIANLFYEVDANNYCVAESFELSDCWECVKEWLQQQQEKTADRPNQLRELRRMDQHTVKKKVREYFEANFDSTISQRKLADQIGCSHGAVGNSPVWKARHHATAQPAASKKTRQTPKKRQLTAEMIRVIPDPHTDTPLKKLITEQVKDFEPSPLDNDPPGELRHRVRTDKKL